LHPRKRAILAKQHDVFLFEILCQISVEFLRTDAVLRHILPVTVLEVSPRDDRVSGSLHVNPHLRFGFDDTRERRNVGEHAARSEIPLVAVRDLAAGDANRASLATRDRQPLIKVVHRRRHCLLEREEGRKGIVIKLRGEIAFLFWLRKLPFSTSGEAHQA
jgi:hypothetical protein